MTLDLRPILSGRSRGPLSSGARFFLWLASFAYRTAVHIRNRQFDRGKRDVLRCAVPVISVGNITTGGTGKTPVVCLLARYLRGKAVRVALVSRGYGRGDADQNDEAEELYQRLPDVPHIQDPDRVAAARIAVEELESECVLMDDGFQHRRLGRDLDLVVVDATCPFGFGHVLPRGLLREPRSGLRRASVVLISRSDQIDAKSLGVIESEIAKHNPHVPILRSIHAPTALLDDHGATTSIESLRGARVLAFCGIGNPEAFQKTMEQAGATVVDLKVFADHAEYSRERIEELAEWARNAEGIEHVLCTHKDLVKVRRDRIGGLPLRAVLVELKIEGFEILAQRMDALLKTSSE